MKIRSAIMPFGVLCAIMLLTTSCERVEFDNPLDIRGNNSSLKCGDDVTASFSERGTLLTISGTGAMWDFYENIAPWHDFESITKVVIENGVTRIGYGAFSGNAGLTSVTIPASVTYISDSAFAHCSGLASVTIPNGVTDIGYGAFYGCAGLTSITIPVSVTSGYDAFGGCVGIDTIIIRGPGAMTDFSGTTYNNRTGEYDDPQVPWLSIRDSVTTVIIGNNVTHIGSNAFAGLVGLKSVTIPNSVTSIGYAAFYGCVGLPSVTIPSGVTNIGGWAFRDCASLTSITIPNGVTNIGFCTFDGCVGLTSITIPSGVTNIGAYAFRGATGLTSITIGNNVESIEYGAFDGCVGLTSITIPNGVTTIEYGAFDDCTGLTSINVTTDNINYSSNDGVLFDKNQTTLVTYPEGKQGAYTIPDGVTHIGDYAFEGCTGLTSITIPVDVTSIGEFVFSDCSQLTSVISLNIVPPTVSNETFRLYSYWNWARDMYNADACLYVPTGSQSAYRSAVGWNVFTCIKDTRAAQVWEDGDNIIAVLIKDGTLAISGTGAMTNYNSASDVPWYEYIDSITSITTGNGITSIGTNAFNGLASVTSMTMGNSVMTIGSSAFRGCVALTSITILNEFAVVTVNDYSVFNGVTTANVKLRVPAAMVSAYQDHQIWKGFSIEAIASGS